MKTSLKALGLAVVLTCSTSALAQAQQFTQDGAMEVKAELSEWIDRQINLLSMAGDQSTAGLKKNGEVTVTPEASYYAAKLPKLTYDLGESGRFEIGQIAANIIPDASGQTWRITVSYPKEMTYFDGTGNALAVVTIGAQRFGGVWDVDKNTYIKYEGAYENIEIRDTLKNIGGAKINNVKFVQNLEPSPGKPGLYSGPMNFEINGVTVKMDDPKNQGMLSMAFDRIIANNDYEDMEIMDTKSMEEKLQAFTKDPEGNMDSYMDSMTEMMAALPNNSDSTAFVEGFDFAFKNPKRNQDMKFSIDRLGLESDMQNIKTNNAGLGFAYIFEGLDVEGIPAESRDFVPSNMTFDIRFDNLPAIKLAELTEATMKQSLDQGSTKTPQQRKQMMMIVMQSLPQLLTEHGTKITMNKTKVDMPIMNTQIRANFSADSSAALKTVGTLMMSITGLDQAIAAMQGMGQSNPNMQGMAQQAMMGLSMFQMMGQMEADGKTRTYNFEVTPDGKTLLNGTDLKQMMGGRQH